MYIYIYIYKILICFIANPCWDFFQNKTPPQLGPNCQELESEGLLTFDSSQPPLHAWVPGVPGKAVQIHRMGNAWWFVRQKNLWEKMGEKCYPLVNVYITMERSTIFHGKIHCNWPFSIAMLVITRG